MTNKEKAKIIRDQSRFCRDLMNRLDKRIQNAKAEDEGRWHPIEGRTRTLADIKRLRRELMDLSKML